MCVCVCVCVFVCVNILFHGMNTILLGHCVRFR